MSRKSRRAARRTAGWPFGAAYVQECPSDYPAPECLKVDPDKRKSKDPNAYTRPWAAHRPTEPAAAVEATVRCLGSMHTLRYENGRLTAVDHRGDGGRLQTMGEFGLKCRCLVVLKGWRERDKRELPDKLKPVYRFVRNAVYHHRRRRDIVVEQADRHGVKLRTRDQMLESAADAVRVDVGALAAAAPAYDVYSDGAKRQRIVTINPIVVPVEEDLGADNLPWTVFDAREATPTRFARLGECSAHVGTRVQACSEDLYRQIREKRPGYHAALTLARLEAGLELPWETVHEVVHLRLKVSWHHKVWQPGLAVVDNHVVVDALSRPELNWLLANPGDATSPGDAWWRALGRPEELTLPCVLALRRVGTKLLLRPARVTAGPAGRPTLVWPEEPARRQRRPAKEYPEGTE